jgi:hypothetical protein
VNTISNNAPSAGADTTPPDIDQQQITEYITGLFGTDPDGYVIVTRKGSLGLQNEAIPACDTHSIVNFIARHALDGDVYVGVGPRATRPASGKRGGRDEVLALPGVWLDIEITDAGHKGTDGLAPDVDAALAIVRAMPFDPTLIVHTGGGIHVYWLFPHPIECAIAPVDLVHLAKSWETLARSIAVELGYPNAVDSVSDIARMLRPPGTLNHKLAEPRPVTVIEAHYDRRYSPEEIEAAIPRDVLDRARRPRARGEDSPPGDRTDGSLPGDEYNACIDICRLIEEDGATYVYTDSEGRKHYARPGKDAGGGVSGNVLDNRLKSFSTEWTVNGVTLDPDRSYSPFQYRAETRHGGDFPAAARAIAAERDAIEADGMTEEAWAAFLDAVCPGWRDIERKFVSDEDDSWRRVDLRDAIAGAVERTLPTVLARADGWCLFYAGRLNGVHGDSGTGKSMVMAVAIAEEVKAGHDVIVVDLEDPDPTTLVERLRMLGVEDGVIIERLHYFGPREEFTDAAVTELVREAKTYDVTLLVVDSLGEAFGLNGVNEDKDAEVGPFLRQYMRPLADAGPAVVLVDHGTKAADNPLHPSGSKRKRAAIQGASYLIEAKRALSREHGGILRLTCAKDRHGNYRRGEEVALVDLYVYPDGGVSVQVSAPGATQQRTPDEEIHALARAAVNALKGQQGRRLGKTELMALMPKARHDLKRAAIERAHGLDSIKIEPEGQRQLHSYVRDLPEIERLDEVQA